MCGIPRVLAILAVVTFSLGGCERSANRSDGGGPATTPPAADTAAVATGDAVATVTPADAPATRSATRPAANAGNAGNAANEGAPERLYGTWVAEDVDVKMGQVKIRLTFKEDGPVKIAAWSDIPFVGQVRDKTAPYEVNGNTISSEAIRGGTTVNYRFDGDDLIIEYKDGKTVRFHRA